jgi:hypothetical protein
VLGPRALVALKAECQLLVLTSELPELLAEPAKWHAALRTALRVRRCHRQRVERQQSVDRLEAVKARLQLARVA